MKVWYNLDEVPGTQKSVVTVGNFDGMHQGHAQVVGTCVARARKYGVDSVALTFDPHPRAVHFPAVPLPAIMSLPDRLDALEVTGLGGTFVAHYDRSLYSLSPEAFVERYLVDRLGAKEVVVGEDFRFGRHNVGNIDTLRRLGRQFGFEVVMVSDLRSATGRRWSSSWVRELLDAGNVSEAASVLGRFHRLTGIVQHGAKRGRKLGFPTANLNATPQVLAPADGVYAGWLVQDANSGSGQEFLPAAISVGTNPQFAAQARTVEAHVLGRHDLDLYDKEITVVFVKRLRPMSKFSSVDDLLKQMDADLLATAATLGARPATRVDPEAVTAGQ